MNIVSFDPFRTLDMPGVRPLAPKSFFQNLDTIREADWIVFPEYWQVNILTYVLQQRIFPNMATYHLGHDKVQMTRALMAVAPQHVPETYILSNSEDNQHKVVSDLFSFPFVAKDVKNSGGSGVFLIKDRKTWETYCADHPILYVQEYLPITRDMRIVVIGRKVVAGYWREQENGRFRTNVAQGGIVSHEPVPLQALALVEWVAQQMDINHAGFDVALVDDHYYFFEFNRLFGNQGLRERGIQPSQLIYEYLLEETPTLRGPQRPLRRVGMGAG